MKFLKENSYDIVKLYINQIGIAIFSLVLYFAVGILDSVDLLISVKISISIFAMLFYFALLYTAAWDMGASDKIRIDGGKMEEKKFKGMLMSLIANIPNFILAVGCAISTGFLLVEPTVAAEVFSAIFNAILRMSASMYLGLIQGIFSSLEGNPELYNFVQSFGYLVAPFLAIIATHIGYLFGLRNKKIFSSKVKN